MAALVPFQRQVALASLDFSQIKMQQSMPGTIAETPMEFVLRYYLSTILISFRWRGKKQPFPKPTSMHCKEYSFSNGAFKKTSSSTS